MAVQALSWEKLVERIRELFASEAMDVEEVKGVMSSYQSDEQDWCKLATFDANRLAHTNITTIIFFTIIL